MMDGRVRNTVEKHSTEFLPLKSFTEDTRENISLLIYSCRLPWHGSICFREEKKKRNLDIFLVKCCNVLLRVWPEIHGDWAWLCFGPIVVTWEDEVFLPHYCREHNSHGRESLDLLSSKWSPWNSMSVNSPMKWHSIHYPRHLCALIFL